MQVMIGMVFGKARDVGPRAATPLCARRRWENTTMAGDVLQHLNIAMPPSWGSTNNYRNVTLAISSFLKPPKRYAHSFVGGICPKCWKTQHRRAGEAGVLAGVAREQTVLGKHKSCILAWEVLQNVKHATPPSTGSTNKSERHRAWECHF